MNNTNATAVLVRQRQIQAVGTAFLRRRPLIVAPAVVVLVAALSQLGVPRTQLLCLAAIKGAMAGFFLWESWHFRERDIGHRGLFLSLAAALLGLTAACAVSGGIRSPLTCLLFAPSALGLAAFGAGRDGRLIFALLLLLGLVLFLLPPMKHFPILPPAAAAVAGFGALVVTAVLLAAGISGLVQAYERAGYSLGQIRAAALQEAEAHPRELEALGARLAHEIKNPLAAVKGLLQLEARQVDSQRSQRRFAVMEGEIARLEQILSEYLSFSRPLSELRRQMVSGPSLVRELLAVLEGRAQALEVQLEQRGDEVGLAVDPALLKQALFNLIANALEASTAGGRVIVTVRAMPEGTWIEVTDTGRGMEPQILQRLGSPFFSTRPSGTGLGVVIATRIARQHGGELRFSSEPGRGTTASLLLPPGPVQATSEGEGQ